MPSEELLYSLSIESLCCTVAGGNKFHYPLSFSKIDANANTMFWVPAGYIAARRVQDADERLSSPYDVPVPVTSIKPQASSLKSSLDVSSSILECTATGVFGDLASLSALAEVVPNAIMEPLMSSATGLIRASGFRATFTRSITRSNANAIATLYKYTSTLGRGPRAARAPEKTVQRSRQRRRQTQSTIL